MRWRGPCQAAPCRFGGQLPGFPVTTGLPPVPATRSSYRFPGPSRGPGVASRWCPFPAVKVFLLLRQGTTQGPSVNYPYYFFRPHDIHRKQAVIRIPRRFSTTLYTTRPQVTGREAGTTVIAIALCDRLILNCRLRVCSQPDRRHELRGCLRDAAVRERCGAPGRKYREDPASLEDFANHRGPDTPQRPDLPRKSGLFGLLHE